MNKREYLRQWRNNNRDKVREHNRTWYRKNKARFRAWGKAYLKRNRQKVNAYHRKRYRDDPERAYLVYIKYRYGATKEYYLSQRDKQKNRCAICGNGPDEGKSRKKRLSVDHNHKTKQLRGLLCTRCNALIGSCLEKVENLKAAIKYLEHYSSLRESQHGR